MWGRSKPEEQQQSPPPGAAAPSGFSGPVIEGHRAEMVPTLAANAEELAKRAPPNRCIRPGCSGQLSIFSGILMIDAGNGIKKPEDSDRCRRKSYVACATCHFPVPVNHPMQQRLDADWRAREEQEKAEADRAAKQRVAQASSPPKPAALINSAMSLPDAVERLYDLHSRLAKDFQAALHRLAAVEKKLAERPEQVPL